MPIYSFVNTQTDEHFEEIMSNASREEFLAANPHIQQTITKANFVSSVGGLKPADGFRDILRTIKRDNKGSTIDTF